MQLERFIHRIERTRGFLALAVVLISLLAVAAGLHGGPRGSTDALPVTELRPADRLLPRMAERSNACDLPTPRPVERERPDVRLL